MTQHYWPPSSDPRSLESRIGSLDTRLTGQEAQLKFLISNMSTALADIEKMKLFFDLYSETVVALHTTAEEHEYRIQKLEGD